MRKTISKAIILSVLMSVCVTLAQVQLLEQGASGFIPFVGAKYNLSNTSLTAGAEYNVEGKFTIGGTYSYTVSDTLFENSAEEVLPFIVTPRVSFEFLEPDRVMPLSFTIQANYSYSRGEDSKNSGVIKSTYEQHKYGGGPELGVRFFVAEAGVLVPCLGYSLYIASYDHVRVIPSGAAFPTTSRDASKENIILHDISFKSPFSYMFSDIFGIIANPELSVRLGGDKSPDFLISLDLGVLIKSF